MKANYYKRKDSQYYWIKWTDPESGKLIRESTKKLIRPNGQVTPVLISDPKGEKKAKEIAKEITAAYTLGYNKTYFIPLEKNTYLFSEAYDLYIKEKTTLQSRNSNTTFESSKKRRKKKKDEIKLSPSTVCICDVVKKHIIEAIGNKSIGDYSEYDFELLEDYFDTNEFMRGKTKKVGFSEHTQAIYTRHAHAIFQYFVDKKNWLDENPVYLLEAEDKEPNPISGEHLKRMFEIAKSDYLHLYTAMFVLLTTALRSSDAIPLDFSQFDFKNNLIFPRNQKSKRFKKPIPLLNVLKDYLIREYNGNVPANGKVIQYRKYSALKSSWDRLMKRTGYSYTLHNFRATYSSLLNDANVPMTKSQKVLGHSSIDTTLRHYTHLEMISIGEEINSKVNFEQLIFGNN